jgi:hypothetical protein
MRVRVAGAQFGGPIEGARGAQLLVALRRRVERFRRPRTVGGFDHLLVLACLEQPSDASPALSDRRDLAATP